MTADVSAPLLAWIALMADCAPADIADVLPPTLREAQAIAGPRDQSCPSGATALALHDPIADIVSASPENTVFCLASGRHRAVTIAPRSGQSFHGSPGAVLDGTRPAGEFRHDGEAWIVATPLIPTTRRGTCRADRPACDRPDLAFLDGAPLERVLSRADLGPGRFMIEPGANIIVLYDDPTGREVDVGAAAFAFLANGARDVTIADLTVTRYANPAQRGAIFDDTDEHATGWTVTHNTVEANAGLGILAGPAARVVANRIVRNGQLGVGLSSDGATVAGNVIAHNNTRGFDAAWEAGGLKATAAHGTRLIGNIVYDNNGPGLWCDIECRDTVYEGNFVGFNAGPGLFHEISYAAAMRDNALLCNGTDAIGWFWDANILIAASESVDVAGNAVVVAEEGTGIALIDQGRGREGTDTLYATRDNTIALNAVRFLGREGRTGGVSDVDPGTPNDGIIAQGDNLYRDNLYIASPDFDGTFAWPGGSEDWAQFRALGQDVGSRLETLPLESPLRSIK